MEQKRIARADATAISSHPGSSLAALSDINAGEKLAGLYDAEVRTTDAILNDEAMGAVLIATSSTRRLHSFASAMVVALLHFDDSGVKCRLSKYLLNLPTDHCEPESCGERGGD
jgi:hypothetical protein